MTVFQRRWQADPQLAPDSHLVSSILSRCSSKKDANYRMLVVVSLQCYYYYFSSRQDFSAMLCRNLGAQLQAPPAHPAPGAGGPAHPPGRGRQEEAGRGRAGSLCWQRRQQQLVVLRDITPGAPIPLGAPFLTRSSGLSAPEELGASPGEASSGAAGGRFGGRREGSVRGG